jgi:hypothetical protein
MENIPQLYKENGFKLPMIVKLENWSEWRKFYVTNVEDFKNIDGESYGIVTGFNIYCNKNRCNRGNEKKLKKIASFKIWELIS